MNKKSFIMYESWGAAINKMSNEQAGQLLKAIYALQDNEDAEPEDPSVSFVFEIIKDKLYEDATEWEKTKQRRSESGKKGMEKRWNEDEGSITNDNTVKESITNDNSVIKPITNDNSVIKPITKDNSVKENITPITVSDSVSVTVSDTVSVSEYVPPTEVKKREARKRFSPPSVAEVATYCRERGNIVDPEAFVDFYAAKGWKVGNAPMKDWRASVRTWEKRDSRAAPKHGSFDANDYLLGIIGEEGAS